MQFQRDELIRQLIQHGWRIASEEENLEWWADEIWLLESVWSPVGCQAYVTFLVDPQFDGVRKKGEEVWAVMASPSKPINRINNEDESTLSLGQGWQKRLTEFIDYLTALRQRLVIQ